MQRTHPELLMPLQATANELVAVSAAITTYQKWLSSTPQSAAENQDTIKLLERFQKRLTMPQEGLYGQP